jgi:hypothetical protein
VKVTKKPTEYTITLDQADLDMLILGLEYAFDHVDTTPFPRPITRFARLAQELRGDVT